MTFRFPLPQIGFPPGVSIPQGVYAPPPTLATSAGALQFGAQAQALAGVQRNLNEALQKRLNQVQQKYENNVTLDLSRQERWRDVRSSISEAETKIQVAADRMEEIKRYVSNIRTALYQIETADSPDARDAQIQIYQSFLKNIDGAVKRATLNTPLLQGGPASAVSYEIDVNRTRQTDFGFKVQTDYSLRKGNEEWRLDRATGALTKFVDGENANYAVSVKDGVRLDAKNPDGTIDVTVALGTALEESIAGLSVEDSGFALKDAWLYGDFATGASIEEARKDLSLFDVEIDNYKLQYEGKLVLTQFYKNRATAAIGVINEKVIANGRRQAVETQEVQAQAALEAQAVARSLQAAEQAGAASVRLLRSANAGFSASAFGAIYDTTA